MFFIFQEVIGVGATNIVVPGNFAIGCVPIYLYLFATNDTSKYDEHHCLRDYNDFATSYNQELIKAIQLLQQHHTNVAIVYADYYSALISVLSNGPQLGNLVTIYLWSSTYKPHFISFTKLSLSMINF